MTATATATELELAVAELARVRGRARTRTLDEGDLLQALDECRRGEPYGSRAAETVANCYSYPAHRMRLVAIRLHSGDYAWTADWGNARQGSSEFPGGGRTDANERALAALRADPAPDLHGWRVLPAAEVHHALADRRRQARARAQVQTAARTAADQARALADGAAPWPPVTVTVGDSLAAGNCLRETERVRAMCGGREAVAAEELREILRREDPALLRYAWRAVARALARKAG